MEQQALGQKVQPINMKFIFLGLYNPLPINSGIDWYYVQILNDLGRNNNVSYFYTVESKCDTGFIPEECFFSTKLLKSKLRWALISKKLEMLKIEFFLFDSGIGNVYADAIFCNVINFHIAKNLSRKADIPIILIMVDIEWQYLKSNNSVLYPLMKVYEHYVMKHVNAIVTISPSDYKYAIQFMPKDRVFYIPPKVNTKIFNPLGKVQKYGDDKFNLLFYGSLDRDQNIYAVDFIVNQLIPHLKKCGLMDKIRVNIFGSGDPKKIACLPNEDINFIGTVKNPGDYIRGADLVIVPVKNTGGMKIRILESLACGKPIISAPEALQGLPDNIKKFVTIGSSVEDFATHIENKIKNNNCQPFKFYEEFLGGDSIDDVLQLLTI